MVAELRLQEVLTEIEIARADVLNDIDFYKPTFTDELATILNKVAHLIEKTETSFKTLQNKFQEDKENETQYRFKIDTKMNEHNTNIVNAVGGFVNAFGGSNRSGGGPAQHSKPDVANHKSIQMLKTFDNDRNNFVEWNDKLINAFARIHPGSRELFKQLNRDWAHSEREKNEDVEKDFITWTRHHLNRGKLDATLEDFNADLYYVLMEKTAGESG